MSRRVSTAKFDEKHIKHMSDQISIETKCEATPQDDLKFELESNTHENNNY